MDDESFMRRKQPTRPYVPTGLVTKVASNLIRETVKVLQSVLNRESACFWLGNIDADGHAVATALVIPKQVNNRGNFSVSAASMQEMAAFARPRGLTNVAAIHSHPGTNVEHSTYDDQMTPSRRALSIVFPLYGHANIHWPVGIGIHEFTDEYWYLLSNEHAMRRVVIDESLPMVKMDLR